MSRKKYNKITLIIFPLTIIIISSLLFLIFHLYMNRPTYNKNLVNENTTISKLYTITSIEDDNYDYVVYGLCNKELSQEDKFLIAFRGKTIEEIEKVVNASDGMLIDVDSYWQDNEIKDVKDFSNENNIIDYVYNNVDEENEDYVNKLLKEIKIYDLESYIGYEEDENATKIIYLFEIAMLGVLLQFIVIIIALEISITTLLKITLLKKKIKE